MHLKLLWKNFTLIDTISDDDSTGNNSAKFKILGQQSMNVIKDALDTESICNVKPGKHQIEEQDKPSKTIYSLWGRLKLAHFQNFESQRL